MNATEKTINKLWTFKHILEDRQKLVIMECQENCEAVKDADRALEKKLRAKMGVSNRDIMQLMADLSKVTFLSVTHYTASHTRTQH